MFPPNSPLGLEDYDAVSTWHAPTKSRRERTLDDFLHGFPEAMRITAAPDLSKEPCWTGSESCYDNTSASVSLFWFACLMKLEH